MYIQKFWKNIVLSTIAASSTSETSGDFSHSANISGQLIPSGTPIGSDTRARNTLRAVSIRRLPAHPGIFIIPARIFERSNGSFITFTPVSLQSKSIHLTAIATDSQYFAMISRFFGTHVFNISSADSISHLEKPNSDNFFNSGIGHGNYDAIFKYFGTHHTPKWILIKCSMLFSYKNTALF